MSNIPWSVCRLMQVAARASVRAILTINRFPPRHESHPLFHPLPFLSNTTSFRFGPTWPEFLSSLWKWPTVFWSGVTRREKFCNKARTPRGPPRRAPLIFLRRRMHNAISPLHFSRHGHAMELVTTKFRQLWPVYPFIYVMNMEGASHPSWRNNSWN